MSDEPRVLDYQTPRKRPRRQFPVLGLMLVLGAVGVLVVLILPLYEPPISIEAARRHGTIAEIEMLSSAIEQFKVDVGRYPTDAEGLTALVTKPLGVTGWNAKYLEEVPVDKWGTPYRYICPIGGDPNKFDIVSAGPDKMFGTADDINRATK